MEASKLTISPENLRFKPLGRTKKASLRRQNIIDLIRSKPNGTPITTREFNEVCGYKGSAGAHQLIQEMIKRGTIVRHLEGLNRYSYYVAADAVKVNEPEAEPSAPETTRLTAPPPISGDITQLAKDFAWRYNSDSLRDFIKWTGDK